jgi:hypothetical protein
VLALGGLDLVRELVVGGRERCRRRVRVGQRAGCQPGVDGRAELVAEAGVEEARLGTRVGLVGAVVGEAGGLATSTRSPPGSPRSPPSGGRVIPLAEVDPLGTVVEPSTQAISPAGETPRRITPPG